jgi:hypothetical protein
LWVLQLFDWVPGNPYDPADDDKLRPVLPEARADRILEILKVRPCPISSVVCGMMLYLGRWLQEAHEWMGKDTKDQVSEEVRRQGGWDAAYDMQPDKPFPERETT